MGGWAGCRMSNRTELAGGKAVVLRAGWPADMRTGRWTVERGGMAGWSATVKDMERRVDRREGELAGRRAGR